MTERGHDGNARHGGLDLDKLASRGDRNSLKKNGMAEPSTESVGHVT
jgi:hypothetical protein